MKLNFFSVLRYTLSLLLILSLAGCGGGAAQRSDELLRLDYQAMSDAELQVYHQRLSDQLAHESRTARTAARRDGLFEGRPPGKEDNGAQAAALRQRWNEVRQELRRRGLFQ